MSASMLNIEERSMKKQNLLAALTAAVVILNGTGTATAQQTPQYQVGGIISPLTITDGPVKPEKKLNKQMTPAEIEFVRQSSWRGLAQTNWRSAMSVKEKFIDQKR